MTRDSAGPLVASCTGKRLHRTVLAPGFRAIFLTAFLFLAADRPLRSQHSLSTETAQGPPITSHVKVVNVLATVRDKKGGIVRGLSRDDFDLKEDDRPQNIRYFSHETDLALNLGVLVDTSLSQRRVLNDERDAAGAFLDGTVRVA